MADIFLSYSEEDREIARKLSELLEAIGWSVWWDRKIPAGRTWRNVLQEALTNMRCMVVLWSDSSIKSNWVNEEAQEGRSKNKLVPVLIESVRPPVGFRAIQAADLINWDRSKDSPGFNQLLAALEALLGRPESRSLEVQANISQASSQKPRLEKHKVRPPSPPNLTQVVVWAGRLPWWPYAVATIIVTMLVASLMGRQGDTSSKIAPASLPVKQLDAGELRIPTPGVDRAPELTIETKPTTKNDANPKDENPANSRTRKSRCTEILARAQLGEPLADDEREMLRTECRS